VVETTDSLKRFTCTMCGFVFTESEAGHACEGCPVSKITHCAKIRCPNCGFENVPAVRKVRENRGGGKTGERDGGNNFLSKLFRGKK